MLIVIVCSFARDVVRDNFVLCEAVVVTYHVHTLIGVIRGGLSGGKEVLASVDAPHQVRNHPRIAFNETANIVAKPSVPLKPSQAWKTAPKLVSPGVPGLRDQM